MPKSDDFIMKLKNGSYASKLEVDGENLPDPYGIPDDMWHY